MKKEWMEILACPIDKYHPLKLYILARSVDEVYEGILLCPACFRWYPIIELIPELLPDHLRDRKRELEFLRKWFRLIPTRILTKGKPFNLCGDTNERTNTTKST